jgi:hypothetical protein
LEVIKVMKSLNHKKKIGTKKKQNGGENQDGRQA